MSPSARIGVQSKTHSTSARSAQKTRRFFTMTTSRKFQTSIAQNRRSGKENRLRKGRAICYTTQKDAGRRELACKGLKRRTTIWILPRRCLSARRVSGGSTARSLSATTRSSPRDITARREGGKTAPTLADVCACRCRCRAGSDMNCAEVSTLRPTRSSPRPGTNALGRICT